MLSQNKEKPNIFVICRHVQQRCRNGLTVQLFFGIECVCLLCVCVCVCVLCVCVCVFVCVCGVCVVYVGQLAGVITRITEHEGGAMLSCQ